MSEGISKIFLKEMKTCVEENKNLTMRENRQFYSLNCYKLIIYLNFNDNIPSQILLNMHESYS